MNSTADLFVGWCSYQAAKYACTKWHYTHSLPTGKLVKIGCWENARFIGTVLISRGSARHIGTPFDLRQDQVAELTRVALRDHVAPVSRICSIAIKMLKRQSPGLRLLISYSDPRQGHHGGIYQAMNWLCIGETHRECLLRVHGRLRHPRSIGSRYGHRGIEWLRAHVDPKAERVVTEAKLKYALPFDEDIRARLLPLAQPYPKRGRSRENAAAPPRAEGGGIPTRPLHDDETPHV